LDLAPQKKERKFNTARVNSRKKNLQKNITLGSQEPMVGEISVKDYNPFSCINETTFQY
jgi:hypothetical protein